MSVMEADTTIDMAPLAPILHEYRARKRDALLPLLHQAQGLYGWLPREVQEAVGRTLQVPLADIHGVIEFYTMFYNQPTSRTVIRVCEGTSCQLAGAAPVMSAIEERLGLRHGETSLDGQVTYERVPCLGMCEHAPNALNGVRTISLLSPDGIDAFLAGSYAEPTAKVYGKPLLALGRVGRIDPTSLSKYEDHGGYQGLRKALKMSPESLIEANKRGKIVGRGGAMFPLGLKAEFVRKAPGNPEEKHVVVNGDESEPGTFKDRTIMEEDPFSVVEAATLMGYMTGAQKGWIFVRGEYPRSYRRLQEAVEKARAAGYLGRDIMGRQGFHFDIELRLGAGAYICGEETALFEAIEGKRGFPRIKPPFPTTNGLFNQPTAINNVETLVMALAALNLGIDEWCRLGTAESPGTKLFCLSGHVSKPGTYEVPFGVTLRELIGMAGGVPGRREIQAILIGGAAGVFIGPEKLDMRLTYEDAQANHVPLGSGSIVLFDETADLRQAMAELSHFFAHESCGKCFPCRLGTQRQMEILQRIARSHPSGNGGPGAYDKKALLDIGFAMKQTSLCGLGQTAASAVMSAIALWPELVA
jgi:NADH-quinone oxidoreductase subunit F